MEFFPKDAIVEMTAMSERALVYSKEDYSHRSIVVYEAVALREGMQDNLTSYFHPLPAVRGSHRVPGHGERQGGKLDHQDHPQAGSD
ncbi:MAG: hypothetical protein M3454_17725 [Actinomycetota bacterium]|nr:hypothetical protein [Actinomycetota bacterium]